MTSEMEVVRSLVQAFNERNVDAVMELFAADAVYHNMPMAPVQGIEAIRRVVESFVSPAEKIDWEISALAQDGGVVLSERMDRFILGGRTIELPVMGAFEVSDGKIQAWRDYFDLHTWQRQTGV